MRDGSWRRRPRPKNCYAWPDRRRRRSAGDRQAVDPVGGRRRAEPLRTVAIVGYGELETDQRRLARHRLEARLQPGHARHALTRMLQRRLGGRLAAERAELDAPVIVPIPIFFGLRPWRGSNHPDRRTVLLVR